jgi:hypothetical protein
MMRLFAMLESTICNHYNVLNYCILLQVEQDAERGDRLAQGHL